MKKKYVCIAAASAICGMLGIIELGKSTGGIEAAGSVAISHGESVMSSSESEDSETSGGLVPVHIDGMVKNPGVYHVSADAIVDDVLKLAGGGTDEADYSGVNLAQSVYAGMKIVIYSVREEDNLKYSGADGAKDNIVNINTADADTLMTLPGIGQSRAEDIIAYRKKNGRFASKEDIMNISGIKTALYNRIKDKITV